MKDATKTLPWQTGTGFPNARDNCANKGEAYFQTDTPTLWTCTVTGTPGTWTQVQSSGIVTAGNGGTGVANTATLTLGTSNQHWATLSTVFRVFEEQRDL
jgi:hypothetical protein